VIAGKIAIPQRRGRRLPCHHRFSRNRSDAITSLPEASCEELMSLASQQDSCGESKRCAFLPIRSVGPNGQEDASLLVTTSTAKVSEAPSVLQQ